MITENLIRDVESIVSIIGNSIGYTESLIEKERALGDGKQFTTRVTKLRIAKSKLVDAERLIQEAYS